MRRLRAKVGGNKRFFDFVEGRGVECGQAREAGQILGQAIGSLGEAAAKAV